jgi:hypothetical protein
VVLRLTTFNALGIDAAGEWGYSERILTVQAVSGSADTREVRAILNSCLIGRPGSPDRILWVELAPRAYGHNSDTSTFRKHLNKVALPQAAAEVYP